MARVDSGSYRGKRYEIYKDGGDYFAKVNGNELPSEPTEDLANKSAESYIDDMLDKDRMAEGRTQMADERMLQEQNFKGFTIKALKHKADKYEVIVSGRDFGSGESIAMAKDAPEAFKKGKEFINDFLEKANGLSRKMSKGEQAMNMKRLQAVAESRARLSAMRTEFAKTQNTIKLAQEQVRLSEKRGSIRNELTKLMAAGKLTPAEFKQVDIKDMATLDEKALKMCLSAYANRSANVVEAGQRGTTDGVDASQLAADAGEKALKARMRSDLMKMSGGKVKFKGMKKLAEGEQEKPAPKAMAEENKPPHPEPDEDDLKKMEEYKAHCKALMGHLESGNIEEAKKCAKHLEAYGAETKSMKHMALGEEAEAYKSAMSSMQEQVDSLTTQMAKLFEEVEKMGSGEETVEMSEEEKDEQKKLAEEEEKKKKELEAAAPPAEEAK